MGATVVSPARNRTVMANVRDEAWADGLYARAENANRAYMANPEVAEQQAFVGRVWAKTAKRHKLSLSPAFFAFNPAEVVKTNFYDAMDKVFMMLRLPAGATVADCFSCEKGDLSSDYYVLTRLGDKVPDLYVRICATCLKRHLEVTHDDVWE